MGMPPLSRKLAQEALDVRARHNMTIEAAQALGIHEATLRGRLRAARQIGLVAAPADPVAAVRGEEKLRDKVFELEAQLKAVRAETLTDEYVRRKIITLSEDLSLVQAPEWAIHMPRGKGLPGIPVAMWSDWHWGEVVYPAQVNGVNEFNLEIAHRRARALVEKTIHLLRHHIVNPDYPGVVLNLGGDMMSGDIHEELSNTNETPIMPCLLDLFGVLRWAIATMADEFGFLFVPCVPGNHGRNSKKPVAKHRSFTNFDWLLYQFLAQSFEDDERITFFIPDGPDALYKVAGHRYLLTHGDQFRGGDGMIGHFGPVLRGQKKKQSRNAGIGLEFDTMIHGHFHTYFPTDKIIGNGSLKGLDEYAFQGNFGYEPPIQALWLTHPEHGVTIHMPVYLERHVGKTADPEADWVSWHKQ